MQRNLDLIRRLLLWAEELPPEGRSGGEFKSEGYSDAEILEHVRLAQEAGWLEAKFVGRELCHVHRLTWGGHEFLDTARKDVFWRKWKGVLAEAALPVSVEVLKAALPEVVKRAFSAL